MMARWTMALAVVLWSLRAGASSSVPAGAPASFSPLARAVWEAGKGRWAGSQNGSFTCYALSQDQADEVMREANFAWTQLGRWLGEESDPRPARLFVIADWGIWNRVLRGARRRKDSLALQVQDEIFLLRDAGSSVDFARLPHELVHLKLWRLYGDRIPLWLDEGLANYLGWRIAGDRQWAHGVLIRRPLAPVPAGECRTPAELQAVRSYRGVGGAFYRQVEDLVAEVARRQGEAQLGAFASAIIRDGLSWEEYWRRGGFTEQDLEQMKEDLKRRVRQKTWR